MRSDRRIWLYGAALLAAATAAAAPDSAPDRNPALRWPAVRREARPWTRWWWLGSAVNEGEITRHLEAFRSAGLGGVEISPIYGAEGSEERNLSYLSPRWVSMLRHTTREGSRLGMGVDMILGTGWPYGGATVTREDAASQLSVARIAPAADGSVVVPAVRGAVLQTLRAYGPSGEIEDLTQRVDSRGRVSWKAPGGDWRLFAVRVKPTGQQVKRAGPGGEGPVLDPFSGDALQRWLTIFKPALDDVPSVERPRALFNDSFEAFGANYTPDLFAQFQRRRGYDLRNCLPALQGDDTPDRVSRVRSDYRQTISDLLLESFTRRWAGWARARNCSVRNQAHGSPGSLIDLYAAADIPETEMFGPVRVKRVVGETKTYSEPIEEILTAKLASSAAHVAGKPYTSSESMTWLAEHFQVTPAEVKNQAHQLFLSGVNHLFYHGSAFSPSGAEWPGWLFYASTDFTPANPWWRDFSAVNGYLTRCQSFLQAGRPDNDVLVYFPIWDLWAKDAGSRDLLQPMTVHGSASWRKQNLLRLSEASYALWQNGYGFDYVSDELLQSVMSVSGGKFVGRSGTYRVLLLAGCERMPPATLHQIGRFVREGGTLAVLDQPPADVPGLGNLEARRADLQTALKSLGLPLAGAGARELAVGQGRVVAAPQLEMLLGKAGVRPERMTASGMAFVRRVDDGWRDYFVVRQELGDYSGWLPISVPAASVVIFDPLTGESGAAEIRQGARGGMQGGMNVGTEVRLEMEAGGSRILRVFDRAVRARKWRYRGMSSPSVELTGEWQLEFLQGGPSLPSPLKTSKLGSWTDLPGDPAAVAARRAFSGSARYRLTFDSPPGKASGGVLDLGEVRHTARVRLNGRDLGTLFAPPYRLALDLPLRKHGNVLELEVTNLAANRIADLDRRKVPWQKFYFVNIDYKKFDASSWEPLPSGLLGPVTLRSTSH